MVWSYEISHGSIILVHTEHPTIITVESDSVPWLHISKWQNVCNTFWIDPYFSFESSIRFVFRYSSVASYHHGTICFLNILKQVWVREYIHGWLVVKQDPMLGQITALVKECEMGLHCLLICDGSFKCHFPTPWVKYVYFSTCCYCGCLVACSRHLSLRSRGRLF